MALPVLYATSLMESSFSAIHSSGARTRSPVVLHFWAKQYLEAQARSREGQGTRIVFAILTAGLPLLFIVLFPIFPFLLLE